MEQKQHRRAMDIFVEQENNLARVIRQLPAEIRATIHSNGKAPVLQTIDDALYTNVEMLRSAVSNQVTGELGDPAKNMYISVLEEKIKNEPNPKKAYVLSLDIDDFGKFNKNYGQLNGDDALRKVASVVSNYCLRNSSDRDNDVRIFHPHGEEMEVLMYVENDAIAQTIAERIRKGVKDHGTFNPRLVDDKTPVQLSISGGLTRYHAEDSLETYDDAFARADATGAYFAKATGKNKIEFVDTNLVNDKVTVSDPSKYEGVEYIK